MMGVAWVCPSCHMTTLSSMSAHNCHGDAEADPGFEEGGDM